MALRPHPHGSLDRPAPPPVSNGGPDRRRFGLLLLGALAGAAALPRPGRASSGPRPSEPRPSGTRVVDLDWTDAARGRSVPVRLYWPATPQGRAPLIVFSHGLGGSRQGYRYLGEYWSARGYASLHVQHVGSDAALWRGDPLQLVSRLTNAARTQEAIHRAHDVSFALDRILDRTGSPFGAAIDPGLIVAAGHSYGANTVLILSGAQVVRDGQTIAARDPRIQAGIAISAPAFYGETDLGPVLGGIRIPTLHVTSTGDVINLPGYRSDAADRFAVFDAVGSPDKLLAVFAGGSHSMFTDRALTGGVHLNPQVKAATAELTTAFLDLAFHADRRALSDWTTAWQPILASPPRLAPTAFAAPRPGRRRLPGPVLQRAGRVCGPALLPPGACGAPA